jgi:hypothetical protein
VEVEKLLWMGEATSRRVDPVYGYDELVEGVVGMRRVCWEILGCLSFSRCLKLGEGLGSGERVGCVIGGVGEGLDKSQEGEPVSLGGIPHFAC